MRTLTFLSAALLITACVAEKPQEKGLVDTSSPPGSPLGLGKADGLANVLPLQVESAHPYANNLNEEFVVDLSEVVPSCTAEVRLHFAALQLEEDYDELHVVDSNGQIVTSFTGNHDDEFSPWLTIRADQQIVSVILESDYSVTRHGFRIDGVEWASDLVCPAYVPALCEEGQIDVNPPQGICQCAGDPTCVDIDALHVRHSIGGGFSGSFHGTRFEGTRAFSFSNLSRTDIPLGTIDETALTRFMDTAIVSGMMYAPSVSDPSNMTEEFSFSVGPHFASYAREAGSYPEQEAHVIAEFDSLFVCGVNRPLTCGEAQECVSGSCVSQDACQCEDVVAPVCGANGQTYDNSCLANCTPTEIIHEGACGLSGDTCGGFQGLVCQPGFRCRFASGLFDYPFPDASGLCVAEDYCDAPQDCELLLHVAVPGVWACQENQCIWQQGSPWAAMPDWSMESAHPYANDTSEWKKLFAPAGATSVRIEIDGVFALEHNYDFLEIWTWSGSSWTQVARFTGTESDDASYEFDGRFHYLHFVSDYSETDHGYSVHASYKR